MSLAEQAMLVELTIKQCTFRKLDKGVTQEVNYDKNAESGAARVNKSTLRKEATKRIQRAVGDMRTFHYKMTSPYSDNGQRLLAIGNHYDYTRRMNELMAEFKEAVDDLCNQYYQLRMDAQDYLGSMYNPDDYPDVDVVRSKFNCTISLFPVPDGNTLDKLAGLSDEEIAKIKQEVKDFEQNRMKLAMDDLWERLHTAVTHMSNSLKDEKKIFRNSLVGNLCELVDLLPKMNLSNDPNLERMRKDVEAKLCSVEADDLRKDTNLRKEVAKDANDLADQMAMYF